MFMTNYKATLKSICRTPLVLMAFGATILLAIALYKGGTYGELELASLRADIWNHVLTSCIHLFPPFVGLMISANILSELQNGFSDLIISSRKSHLSIFISKLCAVATITLIARLVLLAAKLIWFWGFSYPEKYGSIGIQLPLDKIICWYMANEMVHMPLILLCYIAMPVFIIAVTKIPSTGAVWNVGLYLASSVFTAFKGSDFTVPPNSLISFTSTFIYVDTPQFMAELQAGLITNAHGEGAAPLSYAAAAYIGWIVFSLALLTAAYFILKKRYRT